MNTKYRIEQKLKKGKGHEWRSATQAGDYKIDSGQIKYFTNKTNAQKFAQSLRTPARVVKAKKRR